jgi:restriction system protein
MPIPDFQTLMLPVLRDLAQGERTGQETLDALALELKLTPEDLAQRLPSKKQATFTNRVAWAASGFPLGLALRELRESWRAR